jgi:hypothetical protein
MYIQNLSARTEQLGQDEGIAQLSQKICDRTAGDRASGTGHLGQDTWDMSVWTGRPDRSAWRGNHIFTTILL